MRRGQENTLQEYFWLERTQRWFKPVIELLERFLGCKSDAQFLYKALPKYGCSTEDIDEAIEWVKEVERKRYAILKAMTRRQRINYRELSDEEKGQIANHSQTTVEDINQLIKFFEMWYLRNTMSEEVLPVPREGDLVKSAERYGVYSYRIWQSRLMLLSKWVLLVLVFLTGIEATLLPEYILSKTDWLILILCGLTLWFILWSIVSIRIVTNEYGIIYESWWKIIVAEWSEVTDFYDKNDLISTSIVETTHGRFRFSSLVANYEELKKDIKKKATQAKSKEWRKR